MHLTTMELKYMMVINLTLSISETSLSVNDLKTTNC